MPVEHTNQLDADTQQQVLALAQAAAAEDRTFPFDEQVTIRLRHGDPAALHLLLPGSAGVDGYAQVTIPAPIPTSAATEPAETRDLAGSSAPSEDSVAELAVHPRARRQGNGRALLTAAIRVADTYTAGRLRVWAHGDHPGAAALAREFGLTRTRVLHQLRRPLFDPIPPAPMPPGITLRSFRPGRDEAAWLALNARAFADHPEQGRWSEQDLRLRMAEPWFDPDGFLLAERPDGTLLGFHWTKIHSEPGVPPRDPIPPDHLPRDTPPRDNPPAALGEVYVLGVDPEAHGMGLGAALTAAGLRYLHGRGLTEAMLYVDDSNQAAVKLYHKLGFSSWAVDVSYAR